MFYAHGKHEGAPGLAARVRAFRLARGLAARVRALRVALRVARRGVRRGVRPTKAPLPRITRMSSRIADGTRQGRA